MRLLRNSGTDRAIDLLHSWLTPGARVDFVSSSFSLWAFAELKEALDRVDQCRLLLGEPNSIATSLLGGDGDITFRGQLQGRWLARTAAEWIAKKAEIRNARKAPPQSLVFVHGNPSQAKAMMGTCSFTTEGLGLTPGGLLGLVQATNVDAEAASYAGWFETNWNDLRAEPGAKASFLAALEDMASQRAPSVVYFQILYQMFKDLGDELDEERIIKSATGIRDTAVWKKLFRFQRDGVTGAIDKLERIGGCIIADSVGLGKTFEALAVIKYYELRNDRVLVLCPKRLRDNWTLYKANDRRNVLAPDRLNYDVLNHTDLSRDGGLSGDIDLSHVNWGNYDLVVIDESHNFRNKPTHKDRDTRYDHLMKRIIQSGVKTKVLMLSATPVNNRLASVDTSHVAIDVTNSTLLTRIGIGQLLAIRGTTEREYLIAMTERVTRSVREELPRLGDAGEDGATLATVPTDLIQGVLIGTFRTVEGSKSNTFKRGADSFPQIDRDCFVIDGANLQRFMGILGAGFSEDERLKLGTFVADRSADAIASGDKFFQRHAAILGSTGSGKSWAVALILERASKLKFPNIVVFDMHGEYGPLADKTAGGFASRFRVAGPGDLENPGDDVLFLPYWLLNRDEMLSMIVDRSDQNAPNQASRFTSHVRALKGEALDREGKASVKKTFTVDSPVPYDMRRLVELLEADNTTKGVGAKGGAVKGDWEDKLTRFLSRLEAKLDDRRYGFMFAPPTVAMSYDWLAGQVLRLLSSGGSPGIKVIDFSEVPADVLPVVTGTLARLLYDVQFWMASKARTPVTLLCDEAHLYLPVRDDADAVQRQALGAFERIAKEGRKYGFSLLVVSQRPSDVSRTILSQCNNFLALRLTNETDQGVIRRLMPDSLAGLTSILPLLDTGEALLLGDAVLLPTRIKLDIPKITPDSATRDFWSDWGGAKPDDTAIAAAIECLRSQSRS